MWHAIRGCHMIIAMKLISTLDYSDDIELPFFMGYCFSPSTALYGPWISYGAFMKSIKHPHMDRKTIAHLSKNIVYLFMCLLFSTCVLDGILFNDKNLPFS